MGKLILNSVEYVGAESPAIVDVDELPTTNIAKDIFYRKSEDVYVYNQQELDMSTTIWYGDGHSGFIEVIDGDSFIAYNVIGDIVGTFYIDGLTAQDVNLLLNDDIIEVKSSLAESKFFGTPDFYGFSEYVTIGKGGHKLYHNPTARPGKYIEVGGLPKGGTTGQVLAKKSDADGDVVWEDAAGGGSGIVVKRCQKMYDMLSIMPIEARLPTAVRIPLSELGLDTSYDVVAVQDVKVRLSELHPLQSPGFVIVADYCIEETGNLVLWLVSSRDSPADAYGLSFNAYFVKK